MVRKRLNKKQQKEAAKIWAASLIYTSPTDSFYDILEDASVQGILDNLYAIAAKISSKPLASSQQELIDFITTQS